MNKLSCYVNEEELNLYALANDISYTQMRHAQVCYLYHVAKIQRAQIAEITKYAPSTLSSMKNKVLPLLDLAIELFAEIKEELEVVEEELKETFNDAFTKVKRHKGTEVVMNFLENCGNDKQKCEQLYLFKFFTEDSDNEPLFSKIGTTTTYIDSRLRDEIDYYLDHGLNICSVDVCKVLDCGEMPAESYESFLRAALIKRYPGTWQKNDRFFNVDVSIDEFLELFEKFTQM